MKRKILVPAMLSVLIAVTACGHKKDSKKKKEASRQDLSAVIEEPVSSEALEDITAEWPAPSKEAITAMKDKYGSPSSVTENMVVWEQTEPFNRTVVFKEQINHLFPVQHSDVLMQTVSYRVPLDKVGQLAEFDGSLIVDRTKGTISSRNNKEEMNILALNLADKIIKGETTVEQARREYKSNAELILAGRTSPLVSKLRFHSKGNTSDPDTLMQSQEGEY